MATLDELVVRIKADASQLEREMKRVGMVTDRETKKMSKGFSDLQKAISVAVVIASTRKVIQYGDAWTQVQSKLKLVTNSTSDLTNITEKLYQVSQETRTGLEATVTLYQRVAFAASRLGKSQEEVLLFTEQLSKQLVIAGLSSSEASSAILQLTQAINKGVLNGDEFRTVLETMPTLLEAIEVRTGKTRGELIQMAQDGQLTADLIVDSVNEMADTTDERFKEMPLTVDAALVKLENAFQKSIGQNSAIAGMIETLALSLEGIGAILDRITMKLGGIQGMSMDQLYAESAINKNDIRKTQGRLEELRSGPAIIYDEFWGLNTRGNAVKDKEAVLKRQIENQRQIEERLKIFQGQQWGMDNYGPDLPFDRRPKAAGTPGINPSGRRTASTRTQSAAEREVNRVLQERERLIERNRTAHEIMVDESINANEVLGDDIEQRNRELQRVWTEYTGTMETVTDDTADAFDELSVSIRDSLANAFEDAIFEADSFGDSITSILDGIARQIARAGFIDPLSSGIGDFIKGQLDGGGGIGGFLDDLLPSFDVGAWNLPNDMIAKVHKGEMIIPASEAIAIRNGGMGGTTVVHNWNIQSGVTRQELLSIIPGIEANATAKTLAAVERGGRAAQIVGRRN